MAGTHVQAARIADSLIGDLISRCGMDSIWDSMSRDVRLEIRATWIDKAKAILDE